MSALGIGRAELEAQERERLRLEQVRSECSALLAGCDDAISAIHSPAVQQSVAPALREIKQTLEQIRDQQQSSADAALAAARTTQRKLQAAIAGAEAAARKWTQAQRSCQAQLASARAEATAVRAVPGAAAATALHSAETTLTQAQTLLEKGETGAAEKLLQQASQDIDSGRAAALDESVRKTVVKSLLSALRDLGFMVDTPQLLPDQQPGGRVTLVGNLPSGRRARFDVFLDGKLSFDLDGYEGRACGRELESVEQTLASRYRVRLGPPQITWKNPEKISQGKADLPASQSTTRRKD